MRTKKRYQTKRTTRGKYKKKTTKRCRRTQRRTNLDWGKILDGAKTVGGALLNGAKVAGGLVGAAIPHLQMLPNIINVASNVKKNMDAFFADDENEKQEDDTLSDIRRMKLTIIKLSKSMVAKYPKMREHPLYTEMSKLYDDIEMLQNLQSSYDKIELQRQLQPLMMRFKEIIVAYKEVMNQQ